MRLSFILLEVFHGRWLGGKREARGERNIPCNRAVRAERTFFHRRAGVHLPPFVHNVCFRQERAPALHRLCTVTRSRGVRAGRAFAGDRKGSPLPRWEKFLVMATNQNECLSPDVRLRMCGRGARDNRLPHFVTQTKRQKVADCRADGWTSEAG